MNRLSSTRLVLGMLNLCQVLVAGLYLVLVVGTFYAHGLYSQPANLVLGGYFDPKSLAPYADGWLSHALYVLASVSMVAVIGMGVPLLGATVFLLGREYRRLSGHERALSSLGLAVMGLALVLVFSPWGRFIGSWWLD